MKLIRKNKVEKFLLPTQKQQFDTIHEYLHSCSDADDHLATSNAFIHFILGLSNHENAAQIIDHKMQKNKKNVFLTTISLRDFEVAFYGHVTNPFTFTTNCIEFKLALIVYKVTCERAVFC